MVQQECGEKNTLLEKALREKKVIEKELESVSHKIQLVYYSICSMTSNTNMSKIDIIYHFEVYQCICGL